MGSENVIRTPGRWTIWQYSVVLSNAIFIIAQNKNKTHDKNTWEVDNLTILDLSSWLREREAGGEEEKEEQEAEAA